MDFCLNLIYLFLLEHKEGLKQGQGYNLPGSINLGGCFFYFTGYDVWNGLVGEAP